NRGGYTIGIKEQVIFPEVDYNTIYKVKGMNVSIVTTAKIKKETIIFLRKLGFPIREE
ncbi:MAG TPA: 50S ribosomal protein L5, partial [bacterium]|nr:50S ribosomal protein L5 [bacterium]